MSKSSKKSSGPVLPISSSFHHRSLPPSYSSSSNRFTTSSISETTSSFASSTSSSFSSSTNFYNRSTSPTRVNLHHGRFGPTTTSSVSFSIDNKTRSSSPSRSMAVTPRDHVVKKHINLYSNVEKKSCMCSPTTHPGSFRCKLHKNFHNSHSMTYSPNRLNARRSAMTNSLVRIGTVEGELVKRALAALIRPSSHQQRRRAGFQPRPSRLSVMSSADDADDDAM